MNGHFEYIVVGSGACGAHAAQTLAEAKKNVAVLDVGNIDDVYHKIIPDNDFEDIRKNDSLQHRYFLGDQYESIPLEQLKAGAQLTPSRKHLMRDIEKYIPLLSDTFYPMESLAYGGLGAGWGLGCYVYSEKEIIKTGLDINDIKKAYDLISKRIGISCGKDDALPYTMADTKNTLPPLKMDNAAELLYKRYLQKKDKFSKKHITIGNPSMALLSEDYQNRKKSEYKDMDFYSDKGWSAYRAWMTIEEIKQHHGFTYINNNLVLKFKEEKGNVIVESLNTITQKTEYYTCNKLILACGPLGSARIVLRSFPEKIKRLPLLSSPYAYIPCIFTPMMGKPLDRFKSSMAQLSLFYDINGANEDIVYTGLFTYKSLMLYKLIKEAPIDFADGRIIMQYLQSMFIIAGVFHPDELSENKYLELHKSDTAATGDKLFAHYRLSDQEKKKVKQNERAVKSALRKLGCYPAMRLDPGHGSSIHYAGTLPFSDNKEEYGRTAKDGKLNGTENVFIADGSSFRYLPGKGITLTIMAHAHNVAMNAIKSEG